MGIRVATVGTRVVDANRGTLADLSRHAQTEVHLTFEFFAFNRSNRTTVTQLHTGYAFRVTEEAAVSNVSLQGNRHLADHHRSRHASTNRCDLQIVFNIIHVEIGVHSRFGESIGLNAHPFVTDVRSNVHTTQVEVVVSCFSKHLQSGSVFTMRVSNASKCTAGVTIFSGVTHAIGEAYRAIKHGYADAIIAGGSEAATIPLGIAGFANAKALSKAEDPKYASLPFNLNRGGFVMAEGAGMIVLEEYEHAKARGAQIFAEICGYGNTNDAYHITAPRPEGITQAKAIEMALKEAGYNENDVLYVNAHGTGTHLNDASETAAFKIAMGEENARKAHISSTKSMTGHMLGAAGAVEAIASILALKNGIVPPTINLDTPDPECDLNYTPNKAEKVDLTIAISDSLGFGGHNGCIAFRKAE